MRLWLCLRLDELSVQCLPQRRPGAVAVVERQRVHAVNATASLLGLEPGLDLRGARAIAGDESLQLLERDPAAEIRALETLSCWAYGITPDLSCWNGDSLLLDSIEIRWVALSRAHPRRAQSHCIVPRSQDQNVTQVSHWLPNTRCFLQC